MDSLLVESKKLLYVIYFFLINFFYEQGIN